MSILIGIFTFVLLIVSALLVLVVLAQKTKDGGMGSALGGGMTESTFGAETGNVLSKWTINLSITFFVLCFALYLGQLYVRKSAAPAAAALPTMPVASAPVTTPAAAPSTAPAKADSTGGSVTLPAAATQAPEKKN